MASTQETNEHDPLSTLRHALATPTLDPDAERVLLREVAAGSQRALAKLIHAHLRLVVAIAREHARFGVAIDDLVGEGNLGLVQAAARFDVTRGTRFAAYAAWWVRAYIREHTLKNRRIVAMPSTRNARRLTSRLRRTEAALTQRLGCAPTPQQIADELGVSPEDVTMVDRALAGRDVAVGDGPDELGPGLELADGGASPEEQLAERQSEARQAARLRAAMAKLTPRERDVLERHALAGEGASFAKIGRSIGLSRERARQIDAIARRKVREHLEVDAA